MRRAARLALAAAGLASAALSRPPGLRDVADVRFWSYRSYTRVVVELSGALPPRRLEVKRLAADPRSGRGERLYIDLPGVWVGKRYGRPIRVADGLLRAVRLGQNTLRRTRLVLDLESYRRYRLLHLQSPERVVLDVFGRRHRRLGDPHQRPRHLPPALRPVELVVVDPGHGGHDPGAIGVGGLREKDVTLALARELRTELQRRGFRVVLTRDRDRTLDLEQRTAIAEGAGADLFVSLHANASPRRSASGIEIYTLDERAARPALRVAARENGVPIRRLNSLQRVVSHLRLLETRERSIRLAELVRGRLHEGLGARWPSARHVSIKRGPFYVLYLSSMPSLLVEVGFLTHPKEARRLRDPHYLSAFAAQIAEALARYRASESAPVAQAAS